MRPSRLKDALIVLALVAAAGTFAHFYIADRLALLRFIYPLEAFAARLTVDCSDGAPAWLGQILKASTSFAPGGQIAYTEPDGRLHRCEMGWQGKTLISERITADSYFRLASLTKVVTSLAYAKLEREGALRREQPLVEIFRSDVPPKDPRVALIRVEHLLRHSAGFDRLVSVDPMFVMRRRSWCPTQIEKLYQTVLDFAPGERSAYHNLDYCLLGEIIARARGGDFRRAARELLDLGRYDLTFTDGPYLPREVEYDFRNSDFFGRDYYRYFNFEDAAAVISLVGTAQAFNRLVFDNRDLLQEFFERDFAADGCDPGQFESCYYHSMTPMRKPGRNLLLLTHSGNIWGATAFTAVDGFGGVVTWAGKGYPPQGSDDFDRLRWRLYDLLDAHYGASAQAAAGN